MKYVPWKDYKPVTANLKRIYQATTEEQALLALAEFSAKCDDNYPQISRSWQAHWDNLNTLFAYPEDIRRAIYTTNAIESLNSVIRKATKKRKVFPTEDSAKKVVYLAIRQASEKWTIHSCLAILAIAALTMGSYTVLSTVLSFWSVFTIGYLEQCTK